MFDMSFVLNQTMYCEVSSGGYDYTVYTPNVLLADINLDENIYSFEDISDEKLKNKLMGYVSKVFDAFPISAYAEYQQETVNFFKGMQLGFNVIPIQRLTENQIKNVVTITGDEHGANVWTTDKLCSIVPSYANHKFSHRLMLRLTHPHYRYINFSLDTLKC